MTLTAEFAAKKHPDTVTSVPRVLPSTGTVLPDTRPVSGSIRVVSRPTVPVSGSTLSSIRGQTSISSSVSNVFPAQSKYLTYIVCHPKATSTNV